MGVGFLSCFFALVILISCAQCTDEIVSRLQQFICIANFVLQLTALITFMCGLDNDSTKDRCGKDLGMFNPGDCSIGDSLYLLIASIILQLAGIAISFVVCVITRVRATVKTAKTGLKVVNKVTGHDSTDGGKKNVNKSKSGSSNDEKPMEQWSEEEKQELFQQMTENPEVALMFQQLLSGAGGSSSNSGNRGTVDSQV